jgi:hypothetical protein
MKRLIIALSIIAILGVMFPGLPTIAQPDKLPHENPNTTTGLLDEAELLLFYSDIVNLAIQSQYESAQDILSELELASIPDEIQFIINQYTDLFQRLFSTLDNLEAILDEASDLLAHNRIIEVENLLNQAQIEVDNAYMLLEDIGAATNILTDKLGVFAITATSQLTQAYTRLEESLARMNNLISTLKGLNLNLAERYVQKTSLNTPELSLSVDPATAYVGDLISASGRLSSNGKPINGGKLSLYIDGKKVDTAISKFDGSYVTKIFVPYKYKENMTFIMSYEPAGDDIGTYLACSSPPITITTKFYPTLLEVSTHTRLYRGLPFTLEGEVTSNNNTINRQVMVFLDGHKLAEGMSTGQFSFNIMPPEKIPTGPGTLTVDVSPMGRYARAIEHQNVTVSIIPIDFDIQTPSIILLPGEIQISGKVDSQIGPVKNASVRCKFRKSSTTVRTLADGSFTASLKTPLDLLLVGPQEISIDVIPLESWATTNTLKRQVITINPLNISLALVILVALWLVIRRRNRARKYAEEQIPPGEMVEIPAITPIRVSRPKLTDIKGQIIFAYQGVLAAVEKITGVIMSPDITLREFLKITRLPSPLATDRFTELTSITEAVLYSAYSPHKDTVARARELAANIKEELLGETS